MRFILTCIVALYKGFPLKKLISTYWHLRTFWKIGSYYKRTVEQDPDEITTTVS